MSEITPELHLLKAAYHELPKKSDYYDHFIIDYDFWQHDNGDVYFGCGLGDGVNNHFDAPGRVHAVLPDEFLLESAAMKVGHHKVLAYTARTFSEFTERKNVRVYKLD